MPPVSFNPVKPAEDGSELVVSCILRELLAIPPAVLDRPVFAKLRGYLKNYREFHV
jgi:hypothetical protein